MYVSTSPIFLFSFCFGAFSVASEIMIFAYFSNGYSYLHSRYIRIFTKKLATIFIFSIGCNYKSNISILYSIYHHNCIEFSSIFILYYHFLNQVSFGVLLLFMTHAVWLFLFTGIVSHHREFYLHCQFILRSFIWCWVEDFLFLYLNISLHSSPMIFQWSFCFILSSLSLEGLPYLDILMLMVFKVCRVSCFLFHCISCIHIPSHA